MSTAFKMVSLDPAAPVVTVTFDDTVYTVPAGVSLAAGLLAAGVRCLRRTAGTGAPRGPFCLMGTCFDCLIAIDGRTEQACMTRVHDGLVAKRVQSNDSIRSRTP